MSVDNHAERRLIHAYHIFLDAELDGRVLGHAASAVRRETVPQIGTGHVFRAGHAQGAGLGRAHGLAIGHRVSHLPDAQGGGMAHAIFIGHLSQGRLIDRQGSLSLEGQLTRG